MRQLVILTSLTVLLAAGSLGAQSSTQPAQQGADAMSSMWNPQMMIDNSVKQAVQRYHLTPEQSQIARKMTTDGVNAFLDKHEQELRALVGEAVRARISGQTPTPAQAKAWAEKAAPLFEEAKKAILEGNQQFRNSLTDEQKKTFDDDQKVVEKQFSFSDNTLARWKNGDFNPAIDWNNGRGPQGPDAAPQSRPELDRFERYARLFIENYQLDSTQATQVMAIVAENRKRAEEYWHSHKADMQALRNRVQELARDPKNREQYLAATRQLGELNKPVNSLYNEMRERLGRIPTEAQNKAYEAMNEAKRETWREQMRRRGPDTAVSATSQTASSQQILAEDGEPVATRPLTTRPAGTRPAATRPLATRPATQPAGSLARSGPSATQPAAH